MIGDIGEMEESKTRTPPIDWRANFVATMSSELPLRKNIDLSFVCVPAN